jgi:hypothetical protein
MVAETPTGRAASTRPRHVDGRAGQIVTVDPFTVQHDEQAARLGSARIERGELGDDGLRIRPVHESPPTAEAISESVIESTAHAIVRAGPTRSRTRCHRR